MGLFYGLIPVHNQKAKLSTRFGWCSKYYLSIFLYVLTPEGDIRRVPVNQVLGGSCFFLYAMLVVRERSQCLPYNAERQAR